MRIAVIEKEKCRSNKCNWLCIRVCPINRSGKECIVQGEDQKPIISELLCTGCGICPKKCPYNAIHIINLPEALQKPLHQYGENEFRIYRMILPRKKRVIGIIGENAIGKSTVMKVLSNQLIPNLGEYKEKASYGKVIEFFKGSELQEFFKELSQGKTRISFKAQNIDLLPKVIKGKVKELLKKVDEINELENIIKIMNLENCLEKNLNELSGGELQKIAIAATYLKKAEIYCFDEPSSYLDVKERLNIAKVLRTLIEKEKAVIVIEHDLALLDYLSDDIHIIFGEKNAFGVISHIKTTKQGINEYLAGFIKEENIRFRNHEIKFEIKSEQKEKKAIEFIEYPEIEKTFPGFKLKIEKGTLGKGLVHGILGGNAIGKTTFVKLLAGIEKPDKGEVKWNYKIAYKPQYLIPEKATTVKEFFEKNKTHSEYFKEIDSMLKVTTLNEMKLEELSGGQLQKIAIALALSQDAKILLLDEPTAYLDVEERLKIADAIKSITGKRELITLVVDHDILFQDYISDKLIVFNGIPGKKGFAGTTKALEQGMNEFLKEMNITFRRDQNNYRPRANKLNSVKDREQKEKKQYYYMK